MSRRELPWLAGRSATRSRSTTIRRSCWMAWIPLWAKGCDATRRCVALRFMLLDRLTSILRSVG